MTHTRGEGEKLLPCFGAFVHCGGFGGILGSLNGFVKGATGVRVGVGIGRGGGSVGVGYGGGGLY